jgi:hypothetical protein
MATMNPTSTHGSFQAPARLLLSGITKRYPGRGGQLTAWP